MKYIIHIFLIVVFFASGARMVFAYDEIGYSIDSEGDVVCDSVVSTASYRIGRDGVGSNLWQSTGGSGICNPPTAGLRARTDSGNGGNFGADNGQSLDGEAGFYYVTLYSDIAYTTISGFMVFNCPEEGVCTASSDSLSTGTRIISNTPDNNAILLNSVVNTGVYMGANWFVSSEDLQALDTIFSGPEDKIRFSLQVCKLDNFPSGYSCGTVIDYFLPTGFEDSYYEQIMNYAATNPPIAWSPDTDYKITKHLTGANYFNLFGSIFGIEKTTYFTIGSTTASQAPGGLSGTVASTTENNFDSNPFAVISTACNPLSSDFSVGDCLVGVILPRQEALNENLFVITHSPPIGYLVRFYEIASGNATTTATTTLPILSYTSATSSIFAGSTFTFDPFGTLLEVGSIVNAKSDQAQQKTTWEIFDPVARLIVYLALFFMIFHDLTGLRKKYAH